MKEKPTQQPRVPVGLSTAMLFVSGTGGYHTYRIPALAVTTKNTVLAFCEGRRNGRADNGDIDMLVRRSTDGGQTWSKQEVIWNDGPNTCGNPCPVVDSQTGVVWLLMTWNRGDDAEWQIIQQTSNDTRRVRVTRSKDDGRTWSRPKEITSDVKKPNWSWYATGPCTGVQLRTGRHRGRLLIPCDHIEAGTKKYYSHVIYSDDHGKTWKLGGRTPADQVNECQVAELSDGRLMLNARNYDPRKRLRAVSVSADGGRTWSRLRRDGTLIEPICQASLVRYWPKNAEDGRGILLFSNPASQAARKCMTVRVSFDDGRSWPAARRLWAGPSAYSSLAVLPDGRIACLYERGRRHPYQGIALARFRLRLAKSLPVAASQ